ncbi:peptidoglycan-associated lipoprotein Pal [soil metagenome]
MSHFLRSATILIATILISSCASKTGETDGYGQYDPYSSTDYGSDGSIPLPGRDENVSFYGPGSSNVNKSQFTPVYFAFDSFLITGAESSKVGTVASHLRSSPENVLVAGFTDSVGTEEYNRVLGERRALATRDALIGLGIAPQRIQTVSFGEDMPADPGNDAANRRAEFGLVR